MNKLSELLQNRMDVEKMSLRAAAEQIGVSHSTVARVLDGEIVEVDTLVKFSEFLNTPVETLLDLSEGPDKSLEKIGMILNMEPELKQSLITISDQIKKKKLDKKILKDLAAFAAFRLETHLKDKSK